MGIVDKDWRTQQLQSIVIDKGFTCDFD